MAKLRARDNWFKGKQEIDPPEQRIPGQEHSRRQEEESTRMEDHSQGMERKKSLGDSTTGGGEKTGHYTPSGASQKSPQKRRNPPRKNMKKKRGPGRQIETLGGVKKLKKSLKRRDKRRMNANVMQVQLDRLGQYCIDNDTRINQEKTKVAIFNTARIYDFMPRLCIDGNTHLEVVEEFKLLGVKFQSNLRWQANTDFVCKKAYARLWMIRRLKGLGASSDEMLDVFYKQIRCVLEIAVAVWEPGLTQAQSKQLERGQQCAFYIIMGNTFTNYDAAVNFLGSEKLSVRRSTLCLSFALKCEKNLKYKNWFALSEENNVPAPNTRIDKALTKYKPVPSRTDRYMDSPIPYLTNVLNKHYSRKK